MQKQLTTGPVMPTMLQFAVPMILGDLLQQCYNIADTLIVGRFIGTGALAAVGSAFTLMTCWVLPWAAARCSPSNTDKRTMQG